MGREKTVVSDFRFHAHHGENIQLEENGGAATRTSSFANGLVFSSRPVLPGEIFLIQVEENESGWSGFLRLGLTQNNPNSRFSLPTFAIPDLQTVGPSWTLAITKSFSLASTTTEEEEPQEQNRINRLPRAIQREGAMVRTPRGLVRASLLMPFGDKSRLEGSGGTSLLPTDVGSRIGVMFVPTSEWMADMHFIINGVDQGPCCSEIPWKEGSLYAVVDVYGSTKRVRIVPCSSEVESLQSLCRDVILRQIKLSGVATLPLPTCLKDYLLYIDM